jgi:hypothetical protein
MTPDRAPSRRAFVVLALLAVATVAAAGGCGSSAGPDVQEFVSERYGFRVTLTDEWSAADAVVDWDGTKLEGLSSPAFAKFRDPATGRTLVAAAARVPKRMELAGWRAAMVRAAPAICSESPSVEETTLGEEPALAWKATCPDGDAIKIAALHGMRGYIAFLDVHLRKVGTEDRRIFESIRRSFRFTR